LICTPIQNDPYSNYRVYIRYIKNTPSLYVFFKKTELYPISVVDNLMLSECIHNLEHSLTFFVTLLDFVTVTLELLPYIILLSGSLVLPLCFHRAHISFASSWYLFRLSVIVLARLCVFGTAMSIGNVFFSLYTF